MLPDTLPIKRALPPRGARVYILGDTHIGASSCDIDALRDFLRLIETTPDAYLVLVGDILQNSLKSSVGNVYIDQTIPPSGQKELAYELLSPVKDRILAAVGGNHEARSLKDVDDDPLYDVMCRLQIEDVYRRNLAFLRVKQEGQAEGKKNVANYCNFLLMHGKSENKTKNYAYAFEGIDVYVTGHTHSGLVRRPAHLCFTHNGDVTLREVVQVTTCSWLKYEECGYEAANQYMPVVSCRPSCVVLDFVNSRGSKRKIRVEW